MNSETDKHLIEQSLGGNPQAFHQLVLAYQDQVYACAFAVTRNTADAADATQEAFIQFHKHMAQFDTSRNLKPWLLTIVVNRSKNIIRKRVRERKVSIEASEIGFQEVAQESVSRQKDTMEPSLAAQRSERDQGVRSMIKALPQTMREVCSLFYLAECSCKEVAEILAMSETAVRVALNRARKRLLENGIDQWRTA